MTLKDLLENIGEKIVLDAKGTLRKNGKMASKNLYDSIKYKISGTQEQEELEFEMESYGKYVDSGRKPGSKMPPKHSLDAWLKIKNISLKYDYVIRRSIAKKGIKPTYFFTDAYEKYTDDLDKQMEDYLNEIMDAAFM